MRHGGDTMITWGTVGLIVVTAAAVLVICYMAGWLK